MRQTAQDASWPTATLAERWEELHTQAEQLAKLAAIAPEGFDDTLSALPDRLSQASEWQRELAWQGVEDIDAMMQPGLTALRTITARGQDAGAPALALWREFYAARNAVLEVAGEAQLHETAEAA